jgi:predicted secreted hydrolase
VSPAAKGTRRVAARLVAGLAIVIATGAVAALAAESAVTYPDVVPGKPLEFPRDEGSHPEYRTEWWYVTGWLQDAAQPGSRKPLGFQVTFFRVRTGVDESNPSRFAPRQVLFAHAAIADPRYGRLRHAQRSAREGFDLAYARTGLTRVRIDDWSLAREGDGYHASIDDDALSLDLTLRPTQPPLPQGEQGFSRKSPAADAASYYYSVPQLEVRGRVELGGRAREVTGTAWLDHEWSSRALDADARGWDWTGLNLADGSALMAFQMRGKDGKRLWAAATVRARDGRVEVLPQARSSGGRCGAGARRAPAFRTRCAGICARATGASVLVPLLDDAELDSRASTGAIYWEGPVRAEAAGIELGRGYLELTGYADPLRF